MSDNPETNIDTSAQAPAPVDDLSALETRAGAEEGALMTVMDVTGQRPLYNKDGSPMTIRLLGVDSQTYRRAETSAKNARLARMGRRGGSGKITSEEIEAATLTALVAVTREWSITLGGEQPECNEANVRRIYEKYPALREQVEDFVNDRENFTKASAIN